MSIGGLGRCRRVPRAHAERHWREVGKPCTSTVFCCSAAGSISSAATSPRRKERANEARELLDAWPRHSWLQYARLDDHPRAASLRAEALADPEQRERPSFEQAAELKVPAALAVDSVRHSIDRRRRADAVGDACLGANPGRRLRRRLGVGEHRTRQRTGRISQRPRKFQHRAVRAGRGLDWAATAAVPVDAVDEYALVAAGSASSEVVRLTRLGPLPPLQMDPDHRSDHEPLSRAGVRTVRL